MLTQVQTGEGARGLRGLLDSCSPPRRPVCPALCAPQRFSPPSRTRPGALDRSWSQGAALDFPASRTIGLSGAPARTVPAPASMRGERDGGPRGGVRVRRTAHVAECACALRRARAGRGVGLGARLRSGVELALPERLAVCAAHSCCSYVDSLNCQPDDSRASEHRGSTLSFRDGMSAGSFLKRRKPIGLWSYT